MNYTQPSWQQEVLKLTGGKGVDVIYDPVGMIKGPCTPSTVYMSFLELNLPLQTASSASRGRAERSWWASQRVRSRRYNAGRTLSSMYNIYIDELLY